MNDTLAASLPALAAVSPFAAAGRAAHLAGLRLWGANDNTERADGTGAATRSEYERAFCLKLQWRP